MGNADATSGYAPVNGLEMYYEIHGTGEPLVLLHGGVGASEMFAAMVPVFAERRQVITVDLQAHGRTRDIVRLLRSETMADDMKGLLEHLGIARADFMGYSMGAAWRCRRLVAIPRSSVGWWSSP